ncbi:MAG: hypothetical protein KC421_14195 [Anaerolineales bacterium]|nr:hypothetical protein [Anaerolineales bacterium]
MLRHIKKAILQNPIVLAAPMQTTFTKRPFSQTILSPKGFTLDTVQKIALTILIVPTGLGFISSLFSAAWTLFFITGFLLLLCGLIMWIIKLRSDMIWQVTWHHDSVEVEDGRYGPTIHWIEPLAAFIGLKRDFGYIHQSRQYIPNRRVHGLLLVHPDPFKSILLHADRQPIEDEVIVYYETELGQNLVD